MNTNLQDKYQPPKADLNASHLDASKARRLRDVLYPKGRIILSYTLLGGMLGGLLLWVGIGVLDSSIISEIEILGIAIVGGGIIGLVPALMTALMIVYLKIHRRDITDDIKIFVIGALIPAVLTFVIRVIMGFGFEGVFSTLSNIIMFALIMGAVGGLSSLTIGWFVIPKLKT